MNFSRLASSAGFYSFVLLAALMGHASPCEAAEPPALLTTAAEVITLRAREARRARPVRVTGVVILVQLDRDGAIIVQDGSGAIYVRLATPHTSTPRRGDVVVVEGVSDPGRFAPIIAKASCRVTGQAPLPAALPVTLSSLLTARLDGQWVEVTGVVRNVSSRRNWPEDSVVEIVADEVRIPVMFHEVPPEAAARWLDAKITVRGVCFHFCNPKGQLFYSQVAVPAGEPCFSESARVADPFQLPVRALSSLLRYTRDDSESHRVHLQGTVSHVEDTRFFIQERRNGIEVHTHQQPPPVLGTVVDVIGFVSRGAYSPKLEDAEFRETEAKSALLPREVDWREAQTADGELVRTQGRLVNLLWNPNEWILLFEMDQKLFNAYLPHPVGGSKDQTPPWENGSLLSLTGITRSVMGSTTQNQWKWEPRTFQLLLRSPADIAVLQAAPWWKSSHASWAAITALLVVTAGLGIVQVRSGARVREQRRRRQAAEAEFATVLKERTRVAREIHDTLAQGLTSISMQIEMTKEQLTAQPSQALGHLELARALVRGSLAEARRSIWGLRPQILDSQNLSGALAEVGQQLVAGSEIAFRISVAGEELRLAQDIETDLLRIGQEAITNAVKHARPRRIEVDLHYSPRSVRLRVSDDGCGYDPAARASVRADRSGFGITGMRERAAQLHGRLALERRSSGGTELCMDLPLVP